MTPFEMIKAQMARAVPFASHAGIVLTAVGDGEGRAELPQTGTSVNHIGSQHAGALFTLGEAASGAAMAGAFAPVLLDIRPVAAEARIAYRRLARGRIVATAQTARPGAELLASLQAGGKVAFDVAVSLTDDAGAQVAEMSVSWHVSRPRPDR